MGRQNTFWDESQVLQRFIHAPALGEHNLQILHNLQGWKGQEKHRQEIHYQAGPYTPGDVVTGQQQTRRASLGFNHNPLMQRMGAHSQAQPSEQGFWDDSTESRMIIWCRAHLYPSSEALGVVLAVFGFRWSQGTGDSPAAPRDPHHTRWVPIPALLCYITAGVKPARERRGQKEKKKGSFAFQWLSHGPPGPALPVTTVTTEGSAVPGHQPLAETSLLPAPFRPHSPLRKDSSRGIFSNKIK